MNSNNIEKKYKPGTDWAYLLFLFLITNQSMISLKALGVVFIYVLRPNFDFGFNKGRIPKFYFLILILSAFTYVLHVRDFSSNYFIAFIVGNLFWVFGLLAFHQTRLSLEKYGPNGMYRLLKAFTLLNLGFSIYQLIKIMVITGRINPYTKLDFPYGMSTGDNIFGFFMENSYYNMMTSAILAIYFLYKRNVFYAMVASTTLVLVFGNFGTLMFAAVLIAMLVSGIIAKVLSAKAGSILYNIAPRGNYALYIPFLTVYMLSFFLLLSPENYDYVIAKVQSKVFSADGSANNYRNLIKGNPDPTEDAFDIFKETGVVNIGETPKHSLSENTVVLGTASSQKDARKKMSDEYIEKLQGKALSLKETKQFLKSSIGNLLFGAGTARFSSLIAQKMGGRDSSRIFMNILPRFTAPEYALNHKLLIQSRYEADNEYRSNANWPDSVYNQILGEYGLIGAIIFVIFYMGYFVRKYKYFTYTFWILAMMIPFATLSYMFEALSIVIIFELLTITDIEETEQRLLNAEL